MSEETKDIKQDVVEDFFGEGKPDDKPKDTPQDTPKETPKDDKPKENKVDVDAIVKQTTEAVMSQVTPLIQNNSQSATRQRNFDKWINSADGKLFIQYSEVLEQAANDIRYAHLSVSQLPGAILKPQAYAKVLTDAKTKADNEAKDTRAGGTSGRATPSSQNPDELPDFKSMSRDEFANWQKENRSKMKRR